MEAQLVDEEDELAVDNPGSVIDELKDDAEVREFLFQLPGVDRVLTPWYDFKSDLQEDYGFRFGISWTTMYQKASDTTGSDDDAFGFDVNIEGAWNFLGRGTDSPTTLGFHVLHRDSFRGQGPPVTLFTEIGSLYTTATGFADDLGPAIAELWLQHISDSRFGFRIGRLFPVTAYDFFPFKNFRTDFVDFNHVTNVAIPLPDYGLGGFVQFRPQPDVYLRLGVHDANADVEQAGFNSLFDEGELFMIFEAGFDPGFTPREPGRPPFGDVHVSLWRQDERDDDGIDDGWGVGVSASQRFGQFTPFVRYGYADGGASGPTPVQHMVNVGVAVDGIFGQSEDRIGIAYTWSDPANSRLDNQSTIDGFYRVHVTPHIAVGPTLQIIFDPVLNSDDDVVYVGGIRTRLVF